MSGSGSNFLKYDAAVVWPQEEQTDPEEHQHQHLTLQFPYPLVHGSDADTQFVCGAETIHLADHVDDDFESMAIGPGAAGISSTVVADDGQQQNTNERLTTNPLNVFQNHQLDNYDNDTGEPDVHAVVRDPTTLLSGSGETMLAREMAKLSMSERQAVLHDIQ